MSQKHIFTCDICGATSETFTTNDVLWVDIILNWKRGKERCIDICPDCKPKVEKFLNVVTLEAR